MVSISHTGKDSSWNCSKWSTDLHCPGCKEGYHQCLMDEQSQLLTTFLTPFGHFKYKQALYGLSSIMEHYDRGMANASEGLCEFPELLMILSSMLRMKQHTGRTYNSFCNTVERKTLPSTKDAPIWACPPDQPTHLCKDTSRAWLRFHPATADQWAWVCTIL